MYIYTYSQVLFSQGQLERAKVATDTSLVTTAKERDDLLSKYNTARLESKRRRNMIASYQRLIDSQVSLRSMGGNDTVRESACVRTCVRAYVHIATLRVRQIAEKSDSS